MAVPREGVIWAYRLFLGREPESDDVIKQHMSFKDATALATGILRSKEFARSRRFENILQSKNTTVVDVQENKNQQAEKSTVQGLKEISKLDKSTTQNLKKIRIEDLPKQCFRKPNAAFINGTISYPVEDEYKLESLEIGFHGSLEPKTLEGVEITLHSVCNLFLDFSHSNQKISVGKNCSGRWVFHLWGSCTVEIGNGVTSNGTDVMINPGGTLIIGDDCMFANPYIYVGDNHALIDVKSGKTLNYRPAPFVHIGAHVWLASRATVIGDATIGPGSVVAAGAVAKGDFPTCVVASGIPAIVVKEKVSWTRSYEGHGADQVLTLLNEHGAIKS